MDTLISPQTALQTAKLASFPAALLLSGYSLSFPQATMPSLYDHKPQTTTPVFAAIHHRANGVIPTLTLLSTAASAYVAYALPAQRREWTTAAVAMALTVPWGFLVMKKGVERLEAISKDERMKAKSEMSLEHRQLLVRWTKQSWVVVALQLFSGITGLLAVVKA